MRAVVLVGLYIVVMAALVFAAAGSYTLIATWDIKVELGTAIPSMIKNGAAIVLGAGAPYCLIKYIRQ